MFGDFWGEKREEKLVLAVERGEGGYLDRGFSGARKKKGKLEKEARAVNCGGTGRIQQGGFWGSRGLSGELF